MENVPGMWRDELLHPVIVHFPIGLLLVGTLFYFMGLILIRNQKAGFLFPAARTLLFIGVVTSWISVYTGVMADGVVGREVCDPRILELHESLAYYLSYIFTGGFMAEVLTAYFIKSGKASFLLKIAFSLVFIGGSVLVYYVGHNGAKLVYQQAAGVFVPSEDCSEFE